MKAIETTYNGYLFRSRLEARYAVFFDSVGLKWEYEKEGYDLDGKFYLPDFLIHYDPKDYNKVFWLEIKGEHPTLKEIDLCVRLSESTSQSVFIAYGLPGENQIYLIYNASQQGYGPANYELWNDFPLTTILLPLVSTPLVDQTLRLSEVEHAALSAKQARFEHGQIGAPGNWRKQ